MSLGELRRVLKPGGVAVFCLQVLCQRADPF
jgi:hypothetical protein